MTAEINHAEVQQNLKRKTLRQRILEKECPMSEGLYSSEEQLAIDSFLEQFRTKDILRRIFGIRQEEEDVGYTSQELAKKLIEMGYAIDIQDARKLLPELEDLYGTIYGINGPLKFFNDDGIYHLLCYE